MLALAHQGQEGFRVWVVEPGGEVQEHYYTSLTDMVAQAGVFAKRGDSTWNRSVLRVLTATVCSPPSL
jgi:hypothetical protein